MTSTPSAPDTLRRLLQHQPRSKRQLQDLLSATEPPILPLDPWRRALLLCLYRHHPRQAWLGQIVRERLGAHIEDISQWGAFEHPEDIPDDQVPGLPDWSFYFHGVGCCLTHADGTCIDVDFVDGGTDWIDPYFYQTFLQSLPEPEPAEARLRASAPLTGYWMADMEALDAEGLIEGDHRVRLTDAGRRLGGLLAEATSQLAAEPNPWARAWLAWVIGDAQWALSQLTDEAPPAALVAAAEQQTARRISALSATLSNASNSHRHALKALACFGRAVAEPLTLQQLHRQPIDGLVSATLSILAPWADATHIAPLLSLIERASGATIPNPHVRLTAIELVMKLTTPDTMEDAALQILLRGLRQPAGASDGEAGFLLALLSPEEGLERLAHALRSSTPYARQEAAASLGVLDTPEALAILRGAEISEAQEVLALVRGLTPAFYPEPLGQIVMWRGRPKKVYRFEDIRVEGWAARSMERLSQRLQTLCQLWYAH